MSEKKTNECLSNKTAISEKRTDERKCYQIDTSLIITKLVYFIYGAKQSSYEPFMVVFMVSIGLTPSQAGLVGGLRIIGSLLGPPFWAFIADLKNIHKHICMILCFGSLLFMFIQPFLSLSIGESVRNQCPEVDDWTSNTTGNMSLSEKSFKDNENPNNNLFYVMLIINILAKFFDGAQDGFIDNVVIYKCSQHPNQAEYGKQRLFGAIGFGFGVLLSTFAISYFPDSRITCYTGMIIVYSTLTVVFAVILWKLYRDEKFHLKDQAIDRKDQTTVKALSKTLFKVDTILFLLTTLVMGFLSSTYFSFTVFLLKDIGASSLVNGVSIATASFTCIISFYYGSKIICLLKGTWNTFVICCFSYFIRFTCVGYVTEPWLMPAIHTLDSIGFGLFVVTSVLHIKEFCPIKVRTTMYGIFNALFYGGGFIIGNVVGGYVYASYKAKFLFIWAAYFALGWTLLLLIYIGLLRVKSSTKTLTRQKGDLELLGKDN